MNSVIYVHIKFLHSLAEFPWSSFFLCLSFLMNKMGMTTVYITHGSCEKQINLVYNTQQCPANTKLYKKIFMKNSVFLCWLERVVIVAHDLILIFYLAFLITSLKNQYCYITVTYNCIYSFIYTHIHNYLSHRLSLLDFSLIALGKLVISECHFLFCKVKYHLLAEML